MVPLSVLPRLRRGQVNYGIIAARRAFAFRQIGNLSFHGSAAVTQLQGNRIIDIHILPSPPPVSVVRNLKLSSGSARTMRAPSGTFAGGIL